MASYMHEKVEENRNLPARFNLVHTDTATIPVHWHEYLEILYLFEGGLTAVIQAEKYQLSPGQMMVINIQDLHMTRSKEGTAYILLQVSAEQMKLFFPDFDSLHFQTLILPEAKSDGHGGRLLGCMMEMLKEYEEQNDGYQLLLASRLYEFLYYLYRDYSSWSLPMEGNVGVKRDFQRITHTMDWVRHNYREALSLDDAAKALSVSREYFCRLFKKYTGQTFLEYVNTVRTMHFYEELVQSDESITYLMEKNGITNYKVFMRIFKKLYGYTPQQVRKQQETSREN